MLEFFDGLQDIVKGQVCPFLVVPFHMRVPSSSEFFDSGDIDHARQVASRIRAGNVHINGASPGVDVPFGGYKQSGNGREWGAHGFTDYLEIKAISGFEAA